MAEILNEARHLVQSSNTFVNLFFGGVASGIFLTVCLLLVDVFSNSSSIKDTKKDTDEYGQNFRKVYNIFKGLNFITVGIFIYNFVRVFYQSDQTEKQISLIICCISMTLFVGLTGMVLIFQSLDPTSGDEPIVLDVLEKKHNSIFPNSKEPGLWKSKNGHYFHSDGDVINLSREAISSRISKKDYNFVTRSKRSTLEYSREAMFTDILLLSARDELGVVSGGKDWTLAHHEADGNITVETIVVEGTKWNCYRVSGMIEATPMQVASLVIDDNRIGEYDEMFDRIEFLERIDERSSIRHSYYKAIWPTTARDFVINTTWEPLEDGRVIVATRSVDHPLVPSCLEKYVRARVLIAGYVMTPIKGEDGNLITFCDVIIHTDISCDWLPPAFVNPFSNTKPVGYFKNMQRICKEEFPPTPLPKDPKEL
mmetsp:Transcript_25830/g.33878  ORF Transcript_25830/g.33878 Transcript_25830/m.33878 type:complete len:425 (+) Transcript_25830:111-1385(+)|eukprot:CAMPEP_0117767126 /NCGR_PEP_ID=MMETSP0947-20121206/21406_1 /TAXON_ID=44440 /ORGANISM="Chattonella subsalsa, Strain CCMP2191" /LENGTH=424 /DNA_ID=CAMNT_0005590681 /DNA_START=111 /DNA_END=1385 /DNA_ORIENTATION=+